MKLSAGIVGLPNVGKSTLFNAITKLQVEAANYPFATIKPNVGTVAVPDERLYNLSSLINPLKITPAIIQFIDIAGLVKNASKGEGLGNQFLADIREVEAICHVVRCFDSADIVHVENSTDPVRDIEIINLELIISDMNIIEKRIQKISKKAQSGDVAFALEYSVCQKIKKIFDKGIKPLLSEFSDIELQILKTYNLITLKKTIYIANIDEQSLKNPLNNKYVLQVIKYAERENAKVIAISAKIMAEISQLSSEDQQAFMADLNIKESGLETLSKTTYDLLNLQTYFTFGKSEVKAWTFVKGMTAPQCAGIIHSDFEKGFIKCEVIKYLDMMQYKTELAVKEAGKLAIEGKDYLMQDGDICTFKFNVTK